MTKGDLINELKSMNQSFYDDQEEEEDLTGSVWLPVLIDSKMDKGKKEEMLKDPNVKEMDLAAISEKEVFVRQANI
jgi:hypothetical protein